MSTDRDITLNALTLVVRKNDPTIFDNNAVFEYNLCKNGCTAGTPELEALKHSLQQRIPYKIRKNGTTIEVSKLIEIADDFNKRTDLGNELSRWVVSAWTMSMGLKVRKDSESPAVSPSQSSASLESNKTITEEKPVEKKLRPEAFAKPTGRMAIVFGNDSSGSIKVFNAWHGGATKEETSGLVATPIHIVPEPPIPFRAAPKRKEDKPNTVVADKPVDVVASEAVENNNTVTEEVVDSSTKAEEASEKNENSQEFKSTYNMSESEKKAMDLLKKGGNWADVALKILAPIAKSGSVFSCRIMGEVYYYGYGGVKQDFNAALAWLKIAAQLGDVESMFLCGNIHCMGGENWNLDTAIVYYEQAANGGHRKAQMALDGIQNR